MAQQRWMRSSLVFCCLSYGIISIQLAHSILATPAQMSLGVVDETNGTQIKRAAYTRDEPTNSCSSITAGFLLGNGADFKLDQSNPLDRNLSNLLNHDGPDMRPSRDYKDFKDVSIEMSKRALELLHDHSSAVISDRIDLVLPTFERILHEAHTSAKCRLAIGSTLDGAKRMESWAIKLLISWGSFPMSGLFEGTYGDIGSFETCIGIRNNKYIDHAHYCSMTFRPVLPSPKDYELVVRREPLELREHFERVKRIGNKIDIVGVRNNHTEEEKLEQDAFTDILEHAQYNHYVYYKLGTCWPIQCSPFDVRRLAKLVARKNILLNGPVKCYSKNWTDYEETDDSYLASNLNNVNDHHKASINITEIKKKLIISTWDKNAGIFIWKPHFNKPHKIALAVIIVISTFMLFMSALDLVINIIPKLGRKFVLCLKGMPLTNSNQIGAISTFNGSRRTGSRVTFCDDLSGPKQASFQMVPTIEVDASENRLDCNSDIVREPNLFMSLVDDFSIFTNIPVFFRVSEGQMKNDILCLNGIRCITMIWILMTHTMLYNDWSAFARTREVESALNSLLSQPLFNGSYLVDTFFLMSGLLSAFTAFRHCNGMRQKFNSFAYIFGRWLRLTPQIFFVSMMYIAFPALSYGPHWFPIVGEYSENCVNNWWINVLHIQAFYKKEEMCNFVTWWISIDFFYHFFALAIIWIILLLGHRYGFMSLFTLVLSQVMWQSWRHYEQSMPPNVLSTIPQTGAMWTTMTLGFFWTPYTHSVPFFFGFYIGYLMALKKKLILKNLNTRRALIGWTLAILMLVGQGYSTFWWVTGKAGYSKLVSTSFYSLCSIVWSSSLCWIIIACQHGYGGFINRVLSWKVFIVLGKSSYLIYLSHFQILFLYFGNQRLLLEPTTINMIYIILGNILLSTLLGIFLCSIYEIPWLKMHRRLMKYV